MRLTRDAGRYVVAGQYTNTGDTTFNPHLDLNQNHLEVRGQRVVKALIVPLPFRWPLAVFVPLMSQNAEP